MGKKIKLGIASYREDQWELLKLTASDMHVLENTYQEWLENVNRVIKKLKKQGYDPVKVDFDVNLFNEWCNVNNKSPNGESRSEYTTLLLRLNYKYSHN